MRGKVLRFLGSHKLAVTGCVLGAAFLLIGPLLLTLTPSVSAEDFPFGGENVTDGHSGGSANRDAEDGSYQTLTEEDQYTDTNFTGSSESIVTGTGGGTAFPTGLNTADDSRRSYTEASSGAGDYSDTLVPTSDVTVGFDTVYPADGVHYTKVDEGASHDSATTYCRAVTNGDKDILGLGDMSAPSGTPDLDVTIYVICQDAGTGTAYFDAGVVISSTEYTGINDQAAPNTWTSYNYAWELNPATSSEWTYTAINAMNVYVDVYDAAPDVDVTSVYVVVSVDYTDSYTLDAQVTYSSVTSTAQTTGFRVLAEGYRNGDTESVLLQAYNYTSTSWVTKATITASSDTDYSFNLLGWAANCERSSGDLVLLRLVDSGGDATQTVAYLDLLKVMRVEQGYKLDVDMTASSLNEYGALRLKIKGYTSAEEFNVGIWNFTSSAWDSDKISIVALSNTWYTYDILTAHHRSGSETAQIRFTDETAYTADLVRDVLYLDVVWLTWIHADPVLSAYGCDSPKNVGESVAFWATYMDSDNEAPSYIYVNIDGTDYSMVENETDTVYADGKLYHYSTSALPGGEWDYYFHTDDANSGDVATGTSQVTINRIPVLSADGVFPTGGNPGSYSFYVTYTDADGDMPDYIRAVIDGTPYDMTENNSGDTDTTDGKAYYYAKVLAGGAHTYKFITADYLSAEVSTTQDNLNVNNLPVLSGYTREPSDPCYPTTLVWFNVTFTDLDGDLPSAIKWREGEGVTQNLSMTQTDPLDSDTTDGKEYYISVYLSHGAHDFDYYATDGTGHVTGGDGSITIQNRAPEITNDPGSPTSYRNTYWEYDFSVSELDGDTVTWAISHNSSFLSINSASGLVYGTTSDPVAWYDITVWANDSYSGSDSLNFQLSVVNRAPVIDSNGNTTQSLDTFMSYLVLWHDDDSDSCTVEFSSNASWLSESNDYVNGTATPVGWYECTVWVNDSYGGSDMEHWHVTVTDVPANDPPSFTSTPITSVLNNTFYSFDANATDTTVPPDTLTYGLEGNGTAFLSIHASLGYVNGTPTECGWVYVNISCTDGTSTVWSNFTLTSQNSLPVVTTTPSTEGEVGVTYSHDADATDLNSDILAWSTADKPAWLSLDEGTGELTGNPTLEGSYDVRLVVTDSEGGQDWLNWTIVVASGEEPPEEPDDNSSSGTFTLGVRFTYYTHGYTLYVNEDSVSDLIVRVRWDFGDGTGSNLRDTHHTYSEVGAYTVTLTVYDAAGFSQSMSAPVIISLDPDDWLHETDVGWAVVVGNTSLEFPAWLLGGIGGVILASLKFRRGKYERVRLVAGIGLLILALAFYVVW